jgi:hypothetical protein
MSSDLSTMALAAPAAGAADARTRPLVHDVAILCAAAAGVAHGISTPEHFRWWQASGVFFGLLSVFQLGLAVALFLRRTSLRVLLAGIWGNVLVVAVYVASRLTALPGQPGQTAHGAPRAPGRAFLPARAEGIGPFDMFSLVVELALIGALVVMLPALWRRRTSTMLMWGGFAMWGLAVIGLFF